MPIFLREFQVICSISIEVRQEESWKSKVEDCGKGSNIIGRIRGEDHFEDCTYHTYT